MFAATRTSGTTVPGCRKSLVCSACRWTLRRAMSLMLADVPLTADSWVAVWAIA